MAKLIATIEAPEWVDKMFKHWDIDEAGKRKIWQSYVERAVGVDFPINMQADFDAYADSIEESGELDEILES